MSKIVADISMSLDGFATGPNPDPENGLGEGGQPLHDWAVRSDDEVDAEVLRDATEATGAVVMGRRLFDVVDGPADERRVHLAPIVLGAGTRLFSGRERRQLVQQTVRVASAATHLTYRLEA